MEQPTTAERSPEAREAAGTIYGTILVTSLVAGLSEDDSIDAWQLLVSVAATTLVFWAAHAYAEVLSRQMVAGRMITWRAVRDAMAVEWPMVKAGIPAAIALALAALGAYSDDTGEDLAIALGVVLLFAFGISLGRREGATRLQTLAGATLNGLFGLAIVAMKAFVH